MTTFQWRYVPRTYDPEPCYAEACDRRGITVSFVDVDPPEYLWSCRDHAAELEPHCRRLKRERGKR